MRIIPSLCASSAITVKASYSDKKAGGATETHQNFPAVAMDKQRRAVPVPLPVLSVLSLVPRGKDREKGARRERLQYRPWPYLSAFKQCFEQVQFFNASFLFGYVGFCSSLWAYIHIQPSNRFKHDLNSMTQINGEKFHVSKRISTLYSGNYTYSRQRVGDGARKQNGAGFVVDDTEEKRAIYGHGKPIHRSRFIFYLHRSCRGSFCSFLLYLHKGLMLDLPDIEPRRNGAHGGKVCCPVIEGNFHAAFKDFIEGNLIANLKREPLPLLPCLQTMPSSCPTAWLNTIKALQGLPGSGRRYTCLSAVFRKASRPPGIHHHQVGKFSFLEHDGIFLLLPAGGKEHPDVWHQRVWTSRPGSRWRYRKRTVSESMGGSIRS